MNHNLVEIIKETNFNIIKEISENYIYVVSHNLLHHNNFLISMVKNKIFISITVGELKNKSIKVDEIKDNESCYITRLWACFKDSTSEKYRPFKKDEEDMASQMAEHLLEDSGIYNPLKEEHIEISRTIDYESHELFENNIIVEIRGRVGNFLIFEFNFEALEIEHKLEQIQKYIKFQEQAIKALIK